jgi:hypothetical protein
MFEKDTIPSELRFWQGEIPITNLYTAGIAGEKFFGGLKEGRFIGSRCEKCNLTYLPPRCFCERCFSELEEYIELASQGEVLTYTISYRNPTGEILKRPLIVAVIRLEGASTGLVHLVKVDPEKVNIGMKVKAIFAGKKARKGSILDVVYFVPSG